MAIQSSYHAGIDHLGHKHPNDNIHLPNKLSYCHQHKIGREDFSLVTMQASWTESAPFPYLFDLVSKDESMEQDHWSHSGNCFLFNGLYLRHDNNLRQL